MVQHKNTLIAPPFLTVGDIIGIASPASLCERDLLKKGVTLLEGWGFKTKLGRGRIRRRCYLAGSDTDRAEELNGLFADPTVKAILCSRGGYGAMRILDRLDYRGIRRNPKMFVGFSDITVLLAAFWKKAGLMTFHGPMVTTLARTRTADQNQLRSLLLGALPEKISLDEKGRIRGGQSSGVLLGGNLTLLTQLVGTRFEPAWDRLILFVEDQGEKSYRLDRLFVYLKLAGVLDKIKGLLIGQLSEERIPKRDWELFSEMLGDLSVPVWRGLPVGHGRENRPLPIGAPVELDGDRGRLTFLW